MSEKIEQGMSVRLKDGSNGLHPTVHTVTDVNDNLATIRSNPRWGAATSTSVRVDKLVAVCGEIVHDQFRGYHTCGKPVKGSYERRRAYAKATTTETIHVCGVHLSAHNRAVKHEEERKAAAQAARERRDALASMETALRADIDKVIPTANIQIVNAETRVVALTWDDLLDLLRNA